MAVWQVDTHHSIYQPYANWHTIGIKELIISHLLPSQTKIASTAFVFDHQSFFHPFPTLYPRRNAIKKFSQNYTKFIVINSWRFHTDWVFLEPVLPFHATTRLAHWNRHFTFPIWVISPGQKLPYYRCKFFNPNPFSLLANLNTIGNLTLTVVQVPRGGLLVSRYVIVGPWVGPVQLSACW